MKQGDRLKCGCVVGAYWCGPHDIYAVREKSERIWNARPDGSFYMRKAEPNVSTHLADSARIQSMRFSSGGEYPEDYEGPTGCSCHINPPCSWCVSQPDPDAEQTP